MSALEASNDRETLLGKDLESLKAELEEIKLAQASAIADDREKRKADMLTEMMAKIDTVSFDTSLTE